MTVRAFKLKHITDAMIPGQSIVRERDFHDRLAPKIKGIAAVRGRHREHAGDR